MYGEFNENRRLHKKANPKNSFRGREPGTKRKAKAKHHDNSAIAIVKVSEQGWWVKEIIYGRWSLKETAAKIFKAVADYQPLAVGIERGIARDAVGRGFKVFLAEKNKFGSATSSWSTKLTIS